MHLYIRVYGIRLPSVCARISPECGIRSQPVRLPVQCSAVTSAGYELALRGSQTCNIWLPPITHHNRGYENDTVTKRPCVKKERTAVRNKYASIRYVVYGRITLYHH